MTNFIAFLTSMEAIVVYAIAGFCGILWIFIRSVQKTYDKKRLKNNTMELNRLVEEIKEIEGTKEKTTVLNSAVEEETIETVEKIKEQEVMPMAIVPEILMDAHSHESTATDHMILEVIENDIEEEPREENTHIANEEIQYENVEPDQTVAQAELEKLTEELQKAEEKVQNIELTEFEAEQEENAIISLDELLARGDSLYEKNEVTQYQDEGNEPISLQDLEERMKKAKENIVEVQEEHMEQLSLDTEIEIIGEEPAKIEMPTTPKSSEAYNNNHTFKSSPVISPIYGIEDRSSTHSKQAELELENTATLKKFDDEIRKTNEFVMTLKELQKNLE